MMLINTLLLLSTSLLSLALPTHDNQDVVEEIIQNYQQQPQHELLPLNRLLLNDDGEEEVVFEESDTVTSENILDGFSYDPHVAFRAPRQTSRYSGKFRFGYNSDFWNLFVVDDRRDQCVEYYYDPYDNVTTTNYFDNKTNNISEGDIYYNCSGYYNDDIIILDEANYTKYMNESSSSTSNDNLDREYIVGCAWLGLFLFLVFLFWIGAILICYRKGYDKVGFLSGRPFQRRTNHYVDDQTCKKNQQHQQQQQKYDVAQESPQHEHDNSVGQSYDQTSRQNQQQQEEEVSAPKESPQQEHENQKSQSTEGAPYPKTIIDSSFSTTTNNTTEFEEQQHEENVLPNDSILCPSTSNSSAMISSSSTTVEVTTAKGMDKEVFYCNVELVHWIRGIFVVAGISFVIFSILLVTFGLRNLQTTVDTVNDNSEQISNKFMEAYNTINGGVVPVINNSSHIQDVLLYELGRIENGKFCPGIPNIITNENMTATIQNAARVIANELEQLQLSFLLPILERLMRILLRNANQFSYLYDVTSDFYIAGWPSMLILFLGIIIPSLLIISTILSHLHKESKRLNKCIVYFVYPLFIMLVLISILICVGTAVAANANADFCYPKYYINNDEKTIIQSTMPSSEIAMQSSNDYVNLLNSPDVTVLQSLLAMGHHPQSVDFQLFAFYITQCESENPFSFMASFVPKLKQLNLVIDEFFDFLENEGILLNWEQQCGRESSVLTNVLIAVLSDIRSLRDSGLQLLQLVQCDEIVPIYHSLAYDAACQYSVIAVFWIFSSSLLMSVFGLLMISFPSALVPTHYIDDVNDINSNHLDHSQPRNCTSLNNDTDASSKRETSFDDGNPLLIDNNGITIPDDMILDKNIT